MFIIIREILIITFVKFPFISLRFCSRYLIFSICLISIVWNTMNSLPKSSISFTRTNAFKVYSPFIPTRNYLHKCSIRRSFESSKESLIPDNLNTHADETFMRLALRHAQHAYREQEVPIGAILVNENNQVVSYGRNHIEASKDATAHAEVDCLRKASQVLNNWRLLNCTLYTTLEPCPLCLSSMQAFRIKRVVYGAKDPRLGACESYFKLLEKPHPFHQIEVTGGILAEESSILLRRFFQNVRHGYSTINGKSGVGVYTYDRGYLTEELYELANNPDFKAMCSSEQSENSNNASNNGVCN